MTCNIGIGNPSERQGIRHHTINSIIKNIIKKSRKPSIPSYDTQFCSICGHCARSHFQDIYKGRPALILWWRRLIVSDANSQPKNRLLSSDCSHASLFFSFAFYRDLPFKRMNLWHVNTMTHQILLGSLCTYLHVDSLASWPQLFFFSLFNPRQ